MIESLSADELLPRLKPYFDLAYEAGGEVLGEVGKELTSKASGGVTSLGLRAFGAVHRAVRNRIGRARAKKQLNAELKDAANDADREAAYRRFLDADPELRKSLVTLLQRRDYLQALRGFCDDLPISDLVPGSHRLSDVFVPPRLMAVSSRSEPSSSLHHATYDRLLSGNSHIVLGEAGSGKSSLARWLTAKLADSLLNDDSSVALDHLRLPIYVSAADLKPKNWSTSVREAIDSQLGLRGLSKLSNDFFDPHAANGHRLWTVLIDGFDEIDYEAARKSAFQIIEDINNREPEAFHFVLFTRSNSASGALRGFEVWQIDHLRNPQDLIDRYLASAALRQQLSSLLSQPDYREIARNPFFVAMSAALIGQSPTLPATPFALVEAFVDYGVSKTSATKREAILELLKEIARSPDSKVSDLLKTHQTACKGLSDATASIRLQHDVDLALRATGLVKPLQEGGYRFLHRLIDRHLLAELFASAEVPDSSVWSRLDPRSLGWAAVEQLCVRWAEKGQEVGTAIEALADFGSDGLDTMLRLAIQLPDVPDAVLKRPIAELFNELENGELKAVHDDMLPRLAKARPLVRRELHRIVRDSYYSFDMVPAATALSQIGDFEQIRDRLIAALHDEDEDPYTQSEIAELLLDNGLREEALSAFIRVSEEAGDDWMRLDAACRYHREEQSDASRSRLRQILEEDYVNGLSTISPWLMEQVLEFGETDLALPLLREAADASKLRYQQNEFLEFDQCRQAAETLARYDRIEGLSALKALLAVPGISVRQQAELLEEIDKLDPQSNARERLKSLVEATPMQADWRVIEILLDMEMPAVAWTAAKQSVRNQFTAHRFDYGVRQVLERVVPVAPQHEVEALIFEGLARRPIPELAWSLTLIGKSQDARIRLEAMLEAPCRKVGIEAARLLAKVGARRIGKSWLTRLARDRNVAPDLRIEAASDLVSVADARVAMSAYRKLVRDSALDVSTRCQAAKLHSRISSGNDDDVVDALQSIIHGAGPTSDKLAALATACAIDPYEDFIWDAEERFMEILEKGDFGSDDLPIICDLAKIFEISIAKTPSIRTMLLGEKTPLVQRVEALSNLVRASDDKLFAQKALATIAADATNGWRIRKDAIDALHPDLPLRTSKMIDGVIGDPLVPPKWRLAIAQGSWRVSHSRNDLTRLGVIANDRSIEIAIRLEAFKAARRLDPKVGYPDFSDLADLTIYECCSIAEAALPAGLASVAHLYFSKGLDKSPKSVDELVTLFNLSVTLRDEPAKSRLLQEIDQLAPTILRHTEDVTSVLDAIAIIGQIDRDRAFGTLTALLLSDEISIWSVPAVIDRMTDYVGEDDALQMARPVFDEVVGDVLAGRGEHVHAPSALSPFYERGWITNIEPLFTFAQDPGRRIRERIGAIVLAMQTAEGAAKRGRALLNSLIEKVVETIDDGLGVAAELLHAGFHADASGLAIRISEIKPLASEQAFRLARLLDKLGHRNAADRHLKTIELESIMKGYLSDGDKARC